MKKWKLSVSPSPHEWVICVTNNLDIFLNDHASNERKASANALTLVAHYPDRKELVERMIEIAIEELNHFSQVMKILTSRNLTMNPDEKDPYVNRLRKKMNKNDSDQYLLDRLIVGAVIEARGEERFRLLAENLSGHSLQPFYAGIAKSEARHYQTFLALAAHYFEPGKVQENLDKWLEFEKELIVSLPIRNRLH